MGEMTKLEKARRASGITVDAATEIIGVSYPTMLAYQREPSRMSFGQYFALASEMDGDAKTIMSDVLGEVESQAGEWKPLADLTMGEYFAARKRLPQLERELEQAKARVFS